METRRAMRLPLGVVVGFLALVGVGASATHYLQEPYNPGFLQFPTIVALHVVLGGVYLALAPFQFVGRIRSQHLGYHRRAGRLLVAVGLVAGVTGLFMGLVIPFSGWGSG
jgi:nitrate reductase gamma subunit